MFRPNEPFRKEVRYCGEHSNHNDCVVRVLESRGEDDEGASWRIQLPVTGKVVVVYDDELTPQPDQPEMLDERMARFASGFESPLVAAFVLEVVDRYAAEVLKDEAETLRQMENSMVAGPAWIAAAKRAKEIASFK